MKLYVEGKRDCWFVYNSQLSTCEHCFKLIWFTLGDYIVEAIWK